MKARPQAEYIEAIRQLALKARAWVKAHPEARPKVQFNYLAAGQVIATWTQAVEHHYVSLNDDGRALVAAMNEGIPDELESTPTMIRCALGIMEAKDLDTP